MFLMIEGAHLSCKKVKTVGVSSDREVLQSRLHTLAERASLAVCACGRARGRKVAVSGKRGAVRQARIGDARGFAHLSGGLTRGAAGAINLAESTEVTMAFATWCKINM